MNIKIIIILLILIVCLNTYYLYSKKEGYKNASVKFSEDVDNDGEKEYANVNEIGEFKDSNHRTMEKYYGRPSRFENAIETCAKKAYKDGYSFFGLQHPQGMDGKPQCFASNDYSHATSLGTKNNYVGTINKYKWKWRTQSKKIWKRCWKRKGLKKKRTWCKKWVKVSSPYRELYDSLKINSDDYGSMLGNTVYEIDKSDIIYDEAKDLIENIQGNRNYIGNWELVFGRLEDNTLQEVESWVDLLNENRFEQGSTTSKTKDNIGTIHYGIIWRTCENCVGQYKDVFYKRLTPWTQSNDEIKNLFNGQWKTANNVFNVDYQLYSSYSDALNQNNPWEYCPSQDSLEGFPGTCGPKAASTGQSRSTETTEDSKVDWTFLIENVDPSNLGEIETK